jgi:hypothetical protein
MVQITLTASDPVGLGHELYLAYMHFVDAGLAPPLEIEQQPGAGEMAGAQVAA